MGSAKAGLAPLSLQIDVWSTIRYVEIMNMFAEALKRQLKAAVQNVDEITLACTLETVIKDQARGHESTVAAAAA